MTVPLPDDACDCHVHVVGDPLRFPMDPQRPYTPAMAPLRALKNHLTAIRASRVVIVQPSFYGTDNRCMLDALDQLGGTGRGVAVLNPSVSDSDLRDLHVRGVRAVRLNLESSGLRDPGAALQELMAWSARICALPWHLQVYASPEVILGIAAALPMLEVPVVLDHFAMVSSLGQAERVADLLTTGRVFVKLSAPYRLEPSLPQACAELFLTRAPSQVMWGSDWPHTARQPGRGRLEESQYRRVGHDALLAGLHAWLPSDRLIEQVLVTTPNRLYQF